MVVQTQTVFSEGMMMLGLGDIVLPGFFLSFLYRFDVSLQGHLFYFLNGMVGYVMGLILTFTMVVSMEGLAQPALTYLVPCTIIPTIVLGFLRDDLKNLWSGSTGRLHVLTVSNSNIVDDPEDGASIQLQVISQEDMDALDESFSDVPDSVRNTEEPL